MDMNRLTQKSQEALQEAQSAAGRMGHTEVDGEHLLLALVDQEDGLIPRLLEQAGSDPAELRAAVRESLLTAVAATALAAVLGLALATYVLDRGRGTGTLVALAAAVVTFVAWTVAGDTDAAITSTVTVLVIACPTPSAWRSRWSSRSPPRCRHGPGSSSRTASRSRACALSTSCSSTRRAR